MAVEIERKFLVAGDGWREGADGGTPIIQGYLADDGKLAVRVRRKGDKHLLTVKSDKEQAGVRWEFEYPIPADDAAAMLEHLCTADPIDKVRYEVTSGGHLWEIDVFAGANAGLVVAEVELPTADTEVALPEWVGPEVTEDRRYLNTSLYTTPFRDWGVSYADLLAG